VNIDPRSCRVTAGHRNLFSTPRPEALRSACSSTTLPPTSHVTLGSGRPESIFKSQSGYTLVYYRNLPPMTRQVNTTSSPSFRGPNVALRRRPSVFSTTGSSGGTAINKCIVRKIFTNIIYDI
jgi:hypothetical protein